MLSMEEDKKFGTFLSLVVEAIARAIAFQVDAIAFQVDAC